MLKKIIPSMFLFLLLIFSVSAAFSAEIEDVKDQITLSDSAIFNVNIFNSGASTHEYKISGTQNYPDWSIKTLPIRNPILVEVGPNSNKSTTIYFRPNQKYVAIGSYRLNVEVIEQATGTTQILQPKVGVITSGSVQNEYVPTVTAETDFPREIDPSEDLSFTLTLKNQNKRNISNARLIISSKLLNEEVNIELRPEEEKTIDVAKQLDAKTKPMEDTLTIQLIYENDEILGPYTKRYKVTSYSDVKQEVTIKKSFLMSTKTIVFTNEGNVPFEGNVKVETSAMKKFFGSTDPRAEEIKENGVQKYAWSVDHAPYESYTVKVKQNYLGIVILIIAAALIGMFVYYSRSPIVIRKEVTETESTEGGLSKAKLLINIKNRSNKKITEVSIVDKIPKLLDLEKHTTLGSMAPSRIKKNSRHETLILWDIEELMPGEERVINYYVKSGLQILGGLTLQPAMVQFREKEKVRKVRSNRLFIKV